MAPPITWMCCQSTSEAPPMHSKPGPGSAASSWASFAASEPSTAAMVRWCTTLRLPGSGFIPDDVVRDHGADSLRLYEVFLGPVEVAPGAGIEVTLEGLDDDHEPLRPHPEVDHQRGEEQDP